MRTLLLSAVLTLALPHAYAQAAAQSVPPPAHPATAAQLRQIMALTHADESIRRQMQAGIADQLRNGPKFFPAAFWTDFQAEIEKTDWFSFLEPIYQRYYSTEDAAEIIRFYSTPAGQKLLAISQPYLTDVLEKSWALGRSIGAQLGAKYAAQIEANRKAAQPESRSPN